MAEFNANILFNADVRKALQGVDKLEGGVRSLVFEINKFEETFKRIGSGSSNKIALERAQRLAGALNEQNRLLAEQVSIASRLGSQYDTATRSASEFYRVVRAIAEVRQKALPGAGPGQRALPAAGGSSQKLLPAAGQTGATQQLFQRSKEQAAAIDRYNESVDRNIRAANLLTTTINEEIDARRRGTRAAENVTRNIETKLLPGTTAAERGSDVSGAAAGVGSRGAGGRSFQQRLQAEVDRQIQVTGKLNRETLETVAAYNKRQESSDRLVKTEGRLSTALERTAKQATKKSSGVGPGLRGALEGVGFPLLFGAGPGATAFGGLGGFLGGRAGVGFGAQAIGTALGAAIDNYVKGLAKLADSLESTKGIISGLEEAGYKVSEGVKSQIAVYQQAGQESKAYAAAIEEINRILGPDGASKVSDYRVESEKLKQEFSNAKAALDAELLPAMTGFIRLVLELKSAFDKVADSRLGKILGRAFTETITDTTPGLQEGIRVFQGLQQLGAPSGDVQIPFEQTETALAAANKLYEQEQKRLRTIWEAEDAERRRQDVLLAEQEALKLGNDLRDEAVYKAQEQLIHTRAINETLANLGNKEKLRTIEIEKQNALLRLQNRRQAALDRPERKGPKAPESRALQLQAQLIEGDKKLFDIRLQYSRLVAGEEVALRQQNANAAIRLKQELDIIGLKEKQALKNNKVAADAELIKQNAEKQREIIRDQVSLQVTQNNIRLNALRTERAIADVLARQERDGIRTGLNRQIEDVQMRIANPLGGEQVEQMQLQIDQLRRYEDAMNSINNQEEVLKKRIQEGLLGQDLVDANKELDNLAAKKKLYQELLPVLSQVEQQELKLQQTLERFQPVTDALAAGMADIFTSLIDGSKSAEEAFADMLRNMGQQLIQTGTQMIAQYIAIGIARAFAGMGGGGGSLFGGSTLGSYGGDFTGAFMSGAGLRASGGPVQGNQPYIVGERGPELFLPHQSGYVQSNTATRASLPQNNQPRTIRFETTMINNVEYVTKEEAIAIGQQAANDGARRGAKMGQTQTLSGLRNSRSQRSKIGMR